MTESFSASQRFGFGVVGIAAMAAMAHVTIAWTGGYGTAHAIPTIVIAFIVSVFALSLGRILDSRRYVIAAIMLTIMVGVEFVACIRTAERLIEARVERQLPLQKIKQERHRARLRVETAQEHADSLSSPSPRLAASLAALEATRANISKKAAERGCATNCRKLLQAQSDAAHKEVDRARSALNAQRSQAQQELTEAQTALSAIPAARSSTVSADRLGVEPWILDVVTSVLLSVFGNAGAAVCLYLAGHPQRRREVRSEESAVSAIELHEVRDELKHAALFVKQCMDPSEDEHIPISEVRHIYLRWASQGGYRPLSGAEFKEALVGICKVSGLEMRTRRREPVVTGMVAKQEAMMLEAS